MKKVKVVLSIILTIITLLTNSIVSVASSTEEETEGYYTFIKSNGQATITDVDTAISGDVVVPTVLGGCDVISIGEYAFEGCDKVNSIKVPDCVTSIAVGAFKGMASLENMTVPFVGASRNATYYDSVVGYVFGYVTCPQESSSISTFGTDEYRDMKFGSRDDATWQYTCRNYYKFGNYYHNSYYYFIPSSLKSVTITDASTINTAAFQNCSNVSHISLNDGVAIIGNYAFRNCTALEEINIPETTTSLGVESFYNCISLKEIDVLGSITSIPSHCFYGCTSLESVHMSDKIINIDKYAFGECVNLNSFNFSDNLKIISEYAFNNCDMLTAIDIPDNVTSIGKYAFANCDILSEVVFSDSLISIGDYAFDGCSQIKEINFTSKLNTIGEYAFQNCSEIKELVIPNSVTSIGVGAFKGFSKLEKLTIPFVGSTRDATNYRAVLGYIFGYKTQHGGDGFYDSSYNSEYFVSVQHGEFDDATWQYTCINYYSGYAYYLNSYHFYIPSSLYSVTVTDAKQINVAAFMNCTNITEIELNEEIVSFDAWSFMECTALSELHVSNNVTIASTTAFNNCNNLTIYGHSGSYIEDYCNNQNLNFIAYEDVVSIRIANVPENKQYAGMIIDTTGLEIIACFVDGKETVVSDGFSVSPAIVPGGGERTFTINFCNAESTFKINATSINGISILTSPTKVNYIAGDNLDLSGLTLRVYYSDGVTATATEGFTTNIEMLEKSGNILVPINYYGKSTNLKVSVIPLEVTALEIESSPVKNEYFVGDEIDTNGLVLKATYNNGKTESVTDGFEVKTVLDSSDIVEVAVEYSGKTISFPVKVNAVVSTGWTLATEPSKLKYSIGEKIDTTGLTLSEFFNNGSVTTVTEGFICTPETFTESGEQIVTVEYKGSAAMFVVNIHDEGDWLYSGKNIFEKKCNICGDVLESKSVYLTLDCETLEIFNQSNNTINAIVTDNFDCEVSFESSDTSIVAIDENGNITAKSVGEATITATIKDTNIVETCYVTVLPRAYTITWIVDDKIIEEVINEGSEISTPEDPEKIGYTFNGWTPEVPGTMSSDNLTFTATFTANNYDAVFYANGGSWADGKTEKIVSTPYNSEIIIPDTPTRKGYVFVSWAPEVGVMDNINGKKFVAQWSYAEDTPYVVETYTMNTSGEYDKTVENLVGITNSTITVSPVINDGFVLDNEKSIISGKVTADGSLVLKVYINRKSYTLTTISSDTSTQKTYLFGAEVIQPDTPVKEGYQFLGWDSEYPEKMPAKNIVINALWDANSYSAIFEANNGTWTDNSDKKTFSVKYDSEIIAPEIPVRQGYIFSGWIYDGQNLGTNLGIMDNVTGKIFTACWIASTDTIYTVETYTMDVKGEYVKSVQTLSGTTNEVATVTPVVSEGFKLNAETSILDGIISVDNSLVLKVYIDRNVYTITEKVDETEVNKTYYYGSPVSVITSPSKTGHTFVGWDNEIPSTMPAQNIVLTAVFTVNKYEANFDANGGKWSDGKTVKVISTDYNNKIIVPESPSREGYIFSGWSPEVGLMDDVNGKNFVAVWTASTDTVYTVETYLMNTSGEYEKSSQTYTGTTGEVATAEIDVSTGFSLNAEKSIIGGIIKADNSLVLKVYIDRNTYILTTVVDDASTQTAYLYGSIISEPVTPLKDGYKFISWDKSIPETMPAENIVLTAIFKKLYICPYCGKEILGEDAIKEHIASETKVTINGGTLINGDLKPGATITIKAEQIDGKIFSHWIVEGATVEDANSTETTIVLGSGKISITAVYNDCDCKCHQGGIAGFFFKITLFFQKLFGKNLECICGAKH